MSHNLTKLDREYSLEERESEMSENTVPMERRTCPKCSDSMNKVGVPVALPQSLHEGTRKVGDPTPAISLSSVFPVDMYWCEGCRFVELYAG